ncbi:G-type lectin S-receptor-like serine/threonine-protein kinase LECRK1 [Oryza sativa Japonica Group]|jgi:hypothetical protein|uniref:G-type lectin S-receptor-like serine/threonine-protein kinase LECRK4 n=3 Tax=Oryza TaxID=4527 RepID=A3AUT3_ORYSJ|nr:G-type lectin S-receptor-like serine/threonine-protein kinase LECRK1 [Oryza sativa Japonica Group]EAZ31072.1 hypothetical protein OsJ_15168 [Oryza sativa Japonica Group]KAB8095742.1 hypothetical protein EE612_023934 [Oryza sativa]BAS89678.1 Os04g0475100 [Oryza sativa Japonica Group]CAE05486.2 OSJNBa0022H21.6 [Oryza sativa Japonica Group]
MMEPLLTLLVLLLVFTIAPSKARNITLGSLLTTEGVNTSWISPSGDFAFGFQLISTNTYLLAVWFDKTVNKSMAWYAKTNTQVPEVVLVPSGSRLQLSSNGLSLLDPGGHELWNPQVPGAAYANMLDTGNFVLLGADGSTKWGTFDSPADTILPTQGPFSEVQLYSRLTQADYSNGRFLLQVKDGNLEFDLVAVPSGNKYRSYLTPNTGGNGSQLLFNETGGVYFTLKDGTEITITSTIMGSMVNYYQRATLDPDGVFRQYVYPKKEAVTRGWKYIGWTAVDFIPRNICDVFTTSDGSGACGFNSYCSFNWNQNETVECQCPPHYSFIDEARKYKGCKANFQQQSCDLDEATMIDEFDLIPMKGIDWPSADYESFTSVGMDDCQKLCLTDCFCAVTVFNEGNCWKKKLPMSNGRMDSSVDRTLYLKVPKNNNSLSIINTGSIKWKKDKKYWILGSCLLLGSFLLVLILLISFILFGHYFAKKSKKIDPPKQSYSTGGLPLKSFTYEELHEATGGFCEEIGSGGSGVVYKGTLQDQLGTHIAVKKINKVLPDIEKEFAVEVQTIGWTFHKNLVRLLGFCNEGAKRLLVYEFMPNGPLNEFIFCTIRPSWYQRGLLYLHEECSTQIIHCDIKPQNILLDNNLTAKISDFGLAKLLQMDQTQTTTGIRGTRGYVAPEWFKNIAVTAKVDVYSFGVILLEIVCCRRNVEQDIIDEDRAILTDWANDCYRSGRIDLLVEGDEEASFDIKRVQRFLAVALWCIQEDPAMRPTMHKVTQMLDGAVEIAVPPDPASYISSLQ